MWGFAWLSALIERRPVFPGAATPAMPRPLRHQVQDRRDPRLLRHVLARARR